jgi:hypothetical protein
MMTYIRDEAGPRNGDAIWVFENEDGKEFKVLNARYESDADEDGISYFPTWDQISSGGIDFDDDPDMADEYTDDIRDAVRDILKDQE